MVCFFGYISNLKIAKGSKPVSQRGAGQFFRLYTVLYNKSYVCDTFCMFCQHLFKDALVGRDMFLTFVHFMYVMGLDKI